MTELKLLVILAKCIDLNFLAFVSLELLILLISSKLKEDEDVILSSIAQVIEDTFSLGFKGYIIYKIQVYWHIYNTSYNLTRKNYLHTVRSTFS